MATSPSAITPPPGYTIEQPPPATPATLPSGYSIEGAPQQPQAPTARLTRTPTASDLPTFGYPGQPPQERLTMPIAKALMMAHEKLQDVMAMNSQNKLAPEHPIQAKIGDVLSNIEELLLGGQAAGKPMGTSSGLLNNPLTVAGSALATGLEVPGAVADVAGLFKGGKAAEETAEEAPGLIKQVFKGKELEQEPAKTAIRSATGANKESSILQGHETVVDKPIADLFSKERAAYAKQDEIAGFNMKTLQDKLENTEEQIRNLTETEEDVAKEAKLEKSRTAIMDKISEAEGRLKEAGVDPEEAKGFFVKRKAGEDFKKIIKNNASHDGASINVDGLLKDAKNMRFNKYGDRLEQFLGKDGADKFMAKLGEAQKMGAHAMKVQRIAKWLGTISGSGAIGTAAGRIAYEAAH